MLKKLLLGLCAVIIAAGAFLAGILVERYYFTPSPPNLASPVEGAVLTNGGAWEFTWTEVPLAERYRVRVVHPEPPSKEFDITMAPARHRIDWTTATIHEPYLKGWSWKVKAQVGGRWTDWSEVRTFSVQAPAK
jgi:hypothetical protein